MVVFLVGPFTTTNVGGRCALAFPSLLGQACIKFLDGGLLDGGLEGGQGLEKLGLGAWEFVGSVLVCRSLVTRLKAGTGVHVVGAPTA